jgi:hypothetical protein
MLFYPILKCIYFITIPTMLCCVTFMFLLFSLNNLMKLSQSVFWGGYPSAGKGGRGAYFRLGRIG